MASPTNFGRRTIVADFQEARNPTVTDDITALVAVGSIWFNTLTGAVFICSNNTTGAAIWTLMSATGQNPIAQLLSANMNITTDQPFTWLLPTGAKAQITAINAVNPSVSLTTAVGGIYPTTAKGGTAIVAATQAYSALTGPLTVESLTLASTVKAILYQPGAATIVLSLTTAQGAAATADFYVYGDMSSTG
jgi:hypothetical protein